MTRRPVFARRVSAATRNFRRVGFPTAAAVLLSALSPACGDDTGPSPAPDGSTTTPPDGSSDAPEAGLDATLDAVGDAAPDAGGDESEARACTGTFTPGDAGVPATLSIDTSKVVNTFVPRTLFGTNAAYWQTEGDLLQTQAKVQAAGNDFIRYPGGSSSDDYHWNGTGAYDAQQRWVPSDTTFTAGFPGAESFRGTTSISYGTPANLTDGDLTTFWRSNADTDFPAAQWVYVDLGSATQVSSVAITWGAPYATSFAVQTSSNQASYAPPYQGATSQWQNVSTGPVVGAGGAQTVTFTPITTRYVRVLMTASSDGPTGAFAMAELKVSNGATQVSSNVASIAQSATVASSTDPANTPLTQPNFDFEAFMAYAHLFTPSPATPVITVNVGTGTPQEAAAWVHYANIVKKYGIRYWQIGNEMEGYWETGGPLNAQDYARRYIAYYAAMKAVDPTIIILGPVSGGMTEPSNLGDSQTFVGAFIANLAARGLTADIDAIDFHWYPNFGAVPWTTALATTAQIAQFSVILNGYLAAANITRAVPVFMTEYNEALGASSTPVSVNQLIAGLWTANALGEFASSFGGAGGTNLWNIISGGPTPDSTDNTTADLGYLQSNQNAYRFQERAQYWAMQMMSVDWATPGDTTAHELVSSQSSVPQLATYADLRPDGALSLVVINKDETRSFDATLAVPPAFVGIPADVWTFDASRYAWETQTAPYHAEPDEPPAHAVVCGASASTPVTFGPASITVLRFGGSSGGSPDAGAAPKADASATVLIDDMSSANGQIQLAPVIAGDVAGSWYSFEGGGVDAGDVGSLTPVTSLSDGGHTPFLYTPIGGSSGIPAISGAPAEAHAACISGTTSAAQYANAGEGFPFELAPVDGSYAVSYIDISQYRGVQFWIYNGLTDAATVQFQVIDKESDPNAGICGRDASPFNACYSPVYEALALQPGWTLEKVPFAALSVNQYYGYAQPTGGDLSASSQLQFMVMQPDAASTVGLPFSFCVADIAFFE